MSTSINPSVSSTTLAILLVALCLVFVLCYFPSLATIEQSSASVPACPCSIKITTSCYPVPSICCHDLVYDWFESLAQCLHWNVRKRQARLADDLSDDSDTENWNSCSPQSGYISELFQKHGETLQLIRRDQSCGRMLLPLNWGPEQHTQAYINHSQGIHTVNML